MEISTVTQQSPITGRIEKKMPAKTFARRLSRATKPTFVVVQEFTGFRFSWRALQKSSQYALVLITSARHYDGLKRQGELEFFDQVVLQDDFSEAALAARFRCLARDWSDICVVSNDEDSLAATAKAVDLTCLRGFRFKEVECFLDKVAMKRVLESKGIRVPRYLAWDGELYRKAPQEYLGAVEARVGFPAFIKPTNLTASMGTLKVMNREELSAWCEAHVGESCFEIDEFVEGTLYHCDSIIKDGQVCFTQVSRYAYPCYSFFNGRPLGSVTLDSKASNALAQYATDVLMAMPKPSNVVTHMEVFETAKGELIFLEVAARAPGALVVPTYARRFGVNFEEINFRLQMGLAVPAFTSALNYAAWMTFPPNAGTITALYEPQSKSPRAFKWCAAVGDSLKNPSDICAKVASIELWNDDFDVLLDDFRMLSEAKVCDVAATGE